MTPAKPSPHSPDPTSSPAHLPSRPVHQLASQSHPSHPSWQRPPPSHPPQQSPAAPTPHPWSYPLPQVPFMQPHPGGNANPRPSGPYRYPHPPHYSPYSPHTSPYTQPSPTESSYHHDRYGLGPHRDNRYPQPYINREPVSLPQAPVHRYPAWPPYHPYATASLPLGSPVHPERVLKDIRRRSGEMQAEKRDSTSPLTEDAKGREGASSMALDGPQEDVQEESPEQGHAAASEQDTSPEATVDDSRGWNTGTGTSTNEPDAPKILHQDAVGSHSRRVNDDGEDHDMQSESRQPSHSPLASGSPQGDRQPQEPPPLHQPQGVTTSDQMSATNGTVPPQPFLLPPSAWPYYHGNLQATIDTTQYRPPSSGSIETVQLPNQTAQIVTPRIPPPLGPPELPFHSSQQQLQAPSYSLPNTVQYGFNTHPSIRAALESVVQQSKLGSTLGSGAGVRDPRETLLGLMGVPNRDNFGMSHDASRLNLASTDSAIVALLGFCQDLRKMRGGTYEEWLRYIDGHFETGARVQLSFIFRDGFKDLDVLAIYLARLLCILGSECESQINLLSNSVDSDTPTLVLESSRTISSDAEWIWKHPDWLVKWQCRLRSTWHTTSVGRPKMQCLEVVVDSCEQQGDEGKDVEGFGLPLSALRALEIAGHMEDMIGVIALAQDQSLAPREALEKLVTA